MKTIQFGLAEKYDSGDNCSVATNSQFAIEVHNSENFSDIWYHIGKINGATIDWEESHKYSNGYHPSIAVNNNNVVVEVHETSNILTDSLYYKVGTILNGETVDWGEDDKYDSGKQPSISINDYGVVVEVHKSESINTLYYRVGQINDKKIQWGDSHKYDDGVMPSVSINNDGLVVEVHKSESNHKLWYRVGEIKGYNITWGESHEYQDGIAPNIGITNDGLVVEVHESEGSSGLWQLTGQVNGNLITWGTSSNFDSGSKPKMGISLDGEVAVQVHKGDSSELWYSNSKPIDTANFMKNLLPYIGNLPLKKMVIPATHDAGMYSGGVTESLGRTQDLNLYEQLSSGSRYFDLRLNSDKGDLKIHHEFIDGPNLNTVLESIKQFFDEGHQELAILKFSHFDDFSEESYQDMRNAINSYLGKWLFKNLPQGVTRLADVSMGTYLQSGKGVILVVVDKDWAIDYPETGYWVYRDWDSNSPQKGNLTVYDQYSNTTDLAKMEQDQLEKLKNFNGKCKNKPQIPCDLFLLSWTLTPITDVWHYAKEADRVLGREMMAQRQPNQYGYFSNLLYLDYFQNARPVFVADILLKECNDF
jgi:hypothetical protein